MLEWKTSPQLLPTPSLVLGHTGARLHLLMPPRSLPLSEPMGEDRVRGPRNLCHLDSNDKQTHGACPGSPSCPHLHRQNALPHGSQSGHRSRSNNLSRSSPPGLAAWTVCPCQGSWAGWTHDGRRAQVWAGPRAEGAEPGDCSPARKKRTQGE